MKKVLIVFICFLLTAHSCEKKINEASRKKIYKRYADVARPYLDALKPVASAGEHDMLKLQYNRSQAVMIDTKFKRVIANFEKNLKPSDIKDISHFVNCLNQAVKTEFSFPRGFNLPEEFFVAVKVQLDSAKL